MHKLHWINFSEARDERGFYESSDGRFAISPNYRHTVNPDSFTVTDNLTGATFTDERTRYCQAWAEAIRQEEINRGWGNTPRRK